MLNWERTLPIRLFYLMAALILAACGGGGGDLLPPVQGTSNFQLSATIASTNVSPSGSTTVTATLTQPGGAAAAGQTVRFSLSGPGSLSAASAVTNSSGAATVTLNGAGSGSGQVIVTFTDSNNNIATTAVPYAINSGNSILLVTSKSSVNSGVGDSATIDAFVTDASGGAVSNASVTFSVTGGTANGSLNSSTALTDSAGKASVTFSPSTTDRSNKTVTITATNGTATNLVSTTTTINVTGTAITLIAPQNTVALGDTVNITATLRDGNGVAISGQTLAFSSSPTGNVPSATAPATNASGQTTIAATIASQSGGQTIITATGAGATNTLTLTVSTQNFAITTPADGASLPTGTTTTSVSVLFTNNGSPLAGQTIFFSTTLGSISPSSVATNASGIATANISSSFAGQAIIRANTAGNAQVASRTVEFVSSTPQQITAQAASTTVAPGGQTEIVATVRDSANNPVKNQIVQFTLIKNDSNGSLSAPTATTDSSGKASVTFTAGPSSGAQDGTEISATVQSAPTVTTNPGNNAKLSVGGQSAFIALGTGNTMTALNETTYAVPYTVIVTSSDGSPIANQAVNLRVIPIRYYKGIYLFKSGWNTYSGDSQLANPSATPPVVESLGDPIPCSNEDIDLDGTLDATENNGTGVVAQAEDYPGTLDVEDNADGLLWPGLPVTISSGVVTTDSSGLASFNVLYPKSYANWLRVKLVATTQVSGSESKTERIFNLLALATDLSSATVIPPGGTESPFGNRTVCSDKN